MSPARLRTRVLLFVLVISSLLAVESAAEIWRAHRLNVRISDVRAGLDVPIDADAPALLQLARGRWLIAHDRLDAAQQIADRLRAPAPRAALLYALGNARMRYAYRIFREVPFRKVIPIVTLAKSDYRQAISADPTDWDARYNYALAASLVRDTEQAMPTSGDEMSHERAAWPDIPGAPNGMP